MIAIIDYGLGNLFSVYNMIKKIGYKSIITNNPVEVYAADKIIIPGVGHFDEGIKNLKALELWDVLNKKVNDGKSSVLGICLGMQLMCKGSKEGIESGFGWFDADVVKFSESKIFRIPHIGWNELSLCKKIPLTANIEDSRFYFVHSYYVRCNQNEDIVATSNYQNDFTSIINKANIFGVQFHPEKSHSYGMQFFKNFLEYC